MNRERTYFWLMMTAVVVIIINIFNYSIPGMYLDLIIFNIVMCVILMMVVMFCNMNPNEYNPSDSTLEIDLDEEEESEEGK